MINLSLVDKVWEVYEPSFDYNILRSNISNKLLKHKNIKLIRNVNISSIIRNDSSDIEILYNSEKINCDFLVNASYASLKDIISMFSKEVGEAKFQMVALPIMKLKENKSMFGMTIMDGNFCSLIPRGNSKTEFILSHVSKSVIESALTSSRPNFKPFHGIIENDIINESSKYFPILNEMECIDSWITTKMVLPNRSSDDARPSIVIEHANNIVSVFSGKVTTCISSAKKIYKLISHKK